MTHTPHGHEVKALRSEVSRLESLNMDLLERIEAAEKVGRIGALVDIRALLYRELSTRPDRHTVDAIITKFIAKGKP